jgi:cell wall-associated NlpC family hydrolase
MIVDDIVKAARECLDTPYLHQGRLLGRGMDCAGVVVHVAKRLGYKTFDMPGYGRTPYKGLLEQAADNQPYLERINALEPGCVLMMRFTGDPQHVGIYTGDTIIHSYEAVKKVCEHRLDDKWLKRIVRIYRFRDLDL